MKSFLTTIACLTALSLSAGCEDKKEEKVLDIDLPAGGVEVKESDNGVDIEIESSKDGGSSIEIDVPKDDESNDKSQ